MPATHDASSTAAPALPDVLMPRAIPVRTWRETARWRLGIDPACFLVLCSVPGRLLHARIDTVILGIVRLRQRHGVEAMLIVAVGAAADAEQARLRDLVRAMCMRPHVRFVNAAPAGTVVACHAAANVLVSTSWRASDDGVTGDVIPARDPEALAERLARLQRLSWQAQATARSGRAHLVHLAALDRPAVQWQ